MFYFSSYNKYDTKHKSNKKMEGLTMSKIKMDETIRTYNTNLLNIIKNIMTEKEELGLCQDSEKELAKLQYEFFDKKNPDPEITKLKSDIKERFEAVKSKTNQAFNDMTNDEKAKQLCEEFLKQNEKKQKNEKNNKPFWKKVIGF